LNPAELLPEERQLAQCPVVREASRQRVGPERLVRVHRVVASVRQVGRPPVVPAPDLLGHLPLAVRFAAEAVVVQAAVAAVEQTHSTQSSSDRE